MADVPSSLRKVQIEEVSYRSALSESLFFKLGGVINWIIDNAGFKLNDIQASMSDEATFQAARTTDWILMDGRSVIGSDYDLEGHGTNVPDARGRFLRFKDNGVGLTGDLALGTNQSTENLAHQHDGTPEHFSRLAIIERNNVATPPSLPDTTNLLTDTDQAEVTFIGAGTSPISPPPEYGYSIENHIGSGVGYSIGPQVASEGAPFGWCTPVMQVLQDATTFPYFEQEAGFRFGAAVSGANVGTGPARNGEFGIVRGDTIAPNSDVGFNMRVPSNGTNESRPVNTHVNYFIKINN